MKVILVDNYDSFTYNLAHYIVNEGVEVDVVRNDALQLDAMERYDKIIISPGPGLPLETTNLYAIIERYHKTKPILGVCLGMQALGEFFGGQLINLNAVKHGVAITIEHMNNSHLFKQIPTKFQGGLYHSWALALPLPESLILSAISQENVAMACEHRDLPIFGVQFHPESILTEYGPQLIRNFLFNN